MLICTPLTASGANADASSDVSRGTDSSAILARGVDMQDQDTINTAWGILGIFSSSSQMSALYSNSLGATPSEVPACSSCCLLA